MKEIETKRKVALVTGGSRGIGRAICIQLAKDLDYEILVNYNSNKEAAQQTVQEIEAAGGKGQIIHFDVGDSDAVIKGLDLWMQHNKGSLIEVVVNNAGITRDGLFMWMKPEDWHEVINTSLNGFYNVSKALINQMLVNRYGRIINMVSVSGLKGNPGQVNYSAAKSAVIGATKALAQEVAKRNVTVNAVAPGFINSDMTANLDEKELKSMVPANRFGEAEEVAHLVSFLASRKASYITGEIININGGIYS